MKNNAFSVLTNHAGDDIVAWWNEAPVYKREFQSQVETLSRELPDHNFTINLCEDRYLFIVTFLAALLRNQTNLLPMNRVQGVIEDLTNKYNDCYIITDSTLSSLNVKQHVVNSDLLKGAGKSDHKISIPGEHIAAIVFTSGSTGRPSANPKTWESLIISARLIMERFKFDKLDVKAIIATVPPQHMYGLENSVMVPLISGVSIYGERPFFPTDVKMALEATAGLCVLITTPVHLNACIAAKLEWPDLAFIISATAPMPNELAHNVESAFSTRLLEIYGATEVGSIASRRTLDGNLWHIFDDMKIIHEDGSANVDGPQLASPTRLNDTVKLYENNYFELLGRNNDLINIAGKRMSLTDLNIKLTEINGVQDGVYFVPEDNDEKIAVRLTALVIAPDLSTKNILDELKKHIDPVFLPRPLIKVYDLPRNELGKLPRERLLKLIENKAVN